MELVEWFVMSQCYTYYGHALYLCRKIC
uniref:Uncharacterized protein n=1 Tax=Arundo donax TaxID=35708 RepID=A0A0A9EN08_ARUDO